MFVIDRSVFVSRAALVELVRFHLASGTIVQVEDRRRRSDDRLRYEIRPLDGAVMRRRRPADRHLRRRCRLWSLMRKPEMALQPPMALWTDFKWPDRD